MSLFASAFDSGAPAGPSRPLSFGGSPATKAAGGKRKRPSLGDGKADQLRATQVNLEKLMSRVDRGEVKEKQGAEGLGQGAKKGKGAKGGKQQQQPAKQAKPQPKQQQQPKQKQQQPKPDASPKAKKAKHDGGKQKPEGDKPKPKGDKPKPKANPNRPAPVELPLPEVASAADDNLTDMQRAMKAKLEGARFRWINEQLYSTRSDDAVAMMAKDPKIFADYHNTHRALTAGWPSPPLPHIIALLAPLPKASVIADLGCGDAGLARALVPQGKVVLSYDLVGDSGVAGADEERSGKGTDGWVVECDFLTRVPLPGRPGGLAAEPQPKKSKKRDPAAAEVVDAVVCCLSLMGTNWVGGIYEAARILKQGGAFHIAEVTSRFVSTDEFVAVVESFGLTLESQEEPSTHFTLFRFTKTAAVPLGPARGEAGWTERVAAGEDILRACVYKKR
ncbi:Ribosomal RNA-processing protein 8 [Vanrija pseudolonga]|uniref:Ribosomal RNA-processing protein 8 n=1 Tax=Vanrija pseudolonga TaxID=143232 RepID=A0AAF1BIM2_9TREE|nr:Ribosomal RNA-processing protein 8 [Vanrija pseudolonga]